MIHGWLLANQRASQPYHSQPFTPFFGLPYQDGQDSTNFHIVLTGLVLGIKYTADEILSASVETRQPVGSIRRVQSGGLAIYLSQDADSGTFCIFFVHNSCPIALGEFLATEMIERYRTLPIHVLESLEFNPLRATKHLKNRFELVMQDAAQKHLCAPLLSVLHPLIRPQWLFILHGEEEEEEEATEGGAQDPSTPLAPSPEKGKKTPPETKKKKKKQKRRGCCGCLGIGRGRRDSVIDLQEFTFPNITEGGEGDSRLGLTTHQATYPASANPVVSVPPCSRPPSARRPLGHHPAIGLLYLPPSRSEEEVVFETPRTARTTVDPQETRTAGTLDPFPSQEGAYAFFKAWLKERVAGRGSTSPTPRSTQLCWKEDLTLPRKQSPSLTVVVVECPISKTFLVVPLDERSLSGTMTPGCTTGLSTILRESNAECSLLASLISAPVNNAGQMFSFMRAQAISPSGK